MSPFTKAWQMVFPTSSGYLSGTSLGANLVARVTDLRDLSWRQAECLACKTELRSRMPKLSFSGRPPGGSCRGMGNPSTPNLLLVLWGILECVPLSIPSLVLPLTVGPPLLNREEHLRGFPFGFPNGLLESFSLALRQVSLTGGGLFTRNFLSFRIMSWGLLGAGWTLEGWPGLNGSSGISVSASLVSDKSFQDAPNPMRLSVSFIPSLFPLIKPSSSSSFSSAEEEVEQVGVQVGQVLEGQKFPELGPLLGQRGGPEFRSVLLKDPVQEGPGDPGEERVLHQQDGHEHRPRPQDMRERPIPRRQVLRQQVGDLRQH
ncbi:hypothetical protein JZ751_015345 [Albula glossodonta]|uniref:Uncharacterized protein n=1 Tax=Albula glossodonta TaxID=121402 RepID=A0A8T2N3C9_9TELE|nr:hypothetical protein JZ751_015345 [Albula glossodonta]